MSRFARLGTLLLPLLLLTAAAGPVNASDRDTVAGSGARTDSMGGTVFVAVGASSDATGGDPRGTIRVQYESGGIEATAEVTCVAVDGDRAIVFGVFPEPVVIGGRQFPGTEVVIGDLGGPGEDYFRLGFVPASPPTTCTAGSGGLEPDRGNFVVQDAA